MKEKEIINRVAKSSLITIDLEDFYPKEQKVIFDLKPFLFKEAILKEKDFREELKNHDWETYRNKLVAIQCSVDAIIPQWANFLVATYLNPIAKMTTVGALENIDQMYFTVLIENMDFSIYDQKRLIIKGCAHKPIPENAYLRLIYKLQKNAKSIMYGEACSTVPLFKEIKK